MPDTDDDPGCDMQFFCSTIYVDKPLKLLSGQSVLRDVLDLRMERTRTAAVTVSSRRHTRVQG